MSNSWVGQREKDIRNHCRMRLNSVEIPRRIVVMDEIPWLETGKISMNYLVEL